MTIEEIDKMMQAYIEKYDDRFKKVAGQAYKDGVLDVLRSIKAKLERL